MIGIVGALEKAIILDSASSGKTYLKHANPLFAFRFSQEHDQEAGPATQKCLCKASRAGEVDDRRLAVSVKLHV